MGAFRLLICSACFPGWAARRACWEESFCIALWPSPLYCRCCCEAKEILEEVLRGHLQCLFFIFSYQWACVALNEHQGIAGVGRGLWRASGPAPCPGRVTPEQVTQVGFEHLVRRGWQSLGILLQSLSPSKKLFLIFLWNILCSPLCSLSCGWAPLGTVWPHHL